ncbi:MAG: hypothetical protein ACRD16_01145 [Thermoanaerobaculia bacterium]
MTDAVDYTSLDFGQTVPDRSGVIAICPRCGRNGLKQVHGSKESVRYLHSTSRPTAGSEATLQADFCFVPVNHP